MPSTLSSSVKPLRPSPSSSVSRLRPHLSSSVTRLAPSPIIMRHTLDPSPVTIRHTLVPPPAISSHTLAPSSAILFTLALSLTNLSHSLVALSSSPAHACVILYRHLPCFRSEARQSRRPCVSPFITACVHHVIGSSAYWKLRPSFCKCNEARKCSWGVNMLSTPGLI